MEFLSNEDAKIFCQMEKVCNTTREHILPCDFNIPLYSLSGDEFVFTLHSGCLNFGKYTIQNRLKSSNVLIRIDIGSKYHRNPDNTIISGPHVHIYHKGFDDKWA